MTPDTDLPPSPSAEAEQGPSAGCAPTTGSVSSLLEWLDENACELVAETYPIADTSDYDSAWVVYQHEGYPGGTPKRIAMGWGQTPAAAIEDAQRGPEDPEKMDYVPPDCRINYTPSVDKERTKRVARDAAKKVPADQLADAVIWTEAYLEWLRVRVRGLGQNDPGLATAPQRPDLA